MIAEVAIQFAARVERDSSDNGDKLNGVFEIRVSRDGKAFDVSWKRHMGSMTFDEVKKP